MATVYRVIFRGDLVPGASLFDVKRELQTLFKLDDDNLAKLFSGRPVTILKNLDENKATRWQAMLEKAGAQVELRAEEGEAPEPAAPAGDTEPGAPASDGQEEGPFSLEPAGADVLQPGEYQRPEAVAVNTDHLSLDEAGADVLRPDERREEEEPVLDLSHLSVENPE